MRNRMSPTVRRSLVKSFVGGTLILGCIALFAGMLVKRMPGTKADRIAGGKSSRASQVGGATRIEPTPDREAPAARQPGSEPARPEPVAPHAEPDAREESPAAENAWVTPRPPAGGAIARRSAHAASPEPRTWVERIPQVEEFEFVPNRLLVKFAPDATPSDREKTATRTLGGRIAGAIGAAGNTGWVEIELPANLPVRAALETLAGDPAIAYAEPDYVRYALRTPNDPEFGRLFGLHNSGQTGGTPDADIDAPEAWDLATGGDVVVAVIDTGVDYRHPDLAPNAWTNAAEANGQPGVDDDGNGFVDDRYGYDFANNDADPMDDNRHGSHCAGTIAAAGNDGRGVVGVAWSARIMALKFLTAQGSGSTSSAVRCIDYARQNGARVMSNSWGGGGFSQALFDAIENANAADILFVAAAGNEASDNDARPSYPASIRLPNVLAVAAVDHRDQLASFSNTGAQSVHLAAPGVNIYSTVPGGAYANLSGTSMACPHVSGAAVLLFSADGQLTAAAVRAALLAGADPRPNLAGRVSSGARLNVFASLQRVLPAPGAPRLAYDAHVVVDDGRLSTVGNGDGIANPGETVRVQVTVSNRGAQGAIAGRGRASTADARATLLGADDAFGDVAAGANAAGREGFLVALDASIPNGTDLAFQLDTRADNQESVASAFVLRVQSASVIAGRVIDALTGMPIAAAQVTFAGPNSGAIATDALGRYRIDPAVDGDWQLAASAPGYAPSATRDLTLPPSNLAADFRLVRLASISGRVLREANGAVQPIAGVRIDLGGAAEASAVTANDGSYRFDRLAPGDYSVAPALAGLTPASRTLAIEGRDAVNQDFVAAAVPVVSVTQVEQPPLAIPDFDENGAASFLFFPEDRTIEQVRVRVQLRHTYRGDLRVWLFSPWGSAILLHDQTGGSADDLNVWFSAANAPGLGFLAGEGSFGFWTLYVQDLAAQDVGSIESWTVEVAGN